jgi:NAD(P)-dependent dehydrogenase (short-subunit alcohol dehydrogenase family)
MAAFQYYWLSFVFALCVSLFLFIRQNDISEAAFSPLNNVMLGIVGISTMTLFWSPSKTMGTLFRRFALILLVLMQLKNQLDSIGSRVQIQPRKGGFVALVTGGNGSLGRNIAATLMEMDINVIIACRTVSKCQETAEVLKKKLPSKTSFVSFAKYPLDLNDLESVRGFSVRFLEENDRLDYLIHAAGAVSSAGQKTLQGLENSFGSLYLAPFALSHWLMPLLLKPLTTNGNGANAARIVSLVSHSAFEGSFHTSIVQADVKGDFQNEITDNCGKAGELDLLSSLWCSMGKKAMGSQKENGYARAMLATVLSTQELQRRVDQFFLSPGHNVTYRRLVTSTVNPGTVSSTLSPLHVIFGPVLRPPTTAAALVVHALQSDKYQPSSYIDSAFNDQDLGEYSQLGLPTHVSAFLRLHEMNLEFLNERNDGKVYSSSVIKFKAMNFVKNSEEPIAHQAIAARLYDISLQFLSDFQRNKPLYSTKIETTSNVFNFLDL